MLDDLRPYSEYKESALPWLDLIPLHWEEKRSKYYLYEVDDRSTTGTEQLMSVSHKTGVTPRKANVTMFMAESNVGHKICRPGDVVVNTMWAWMAAMGVAHQIGLVSPSYGVYRPRSAFSYVPDYLDHLVRIHPYVSEYICRSTGIRASRLRLYPDDFLCIPFICPPIQEQKAIVRFINHYDRLVRRFFRNRRRLIEVLNEQKQAIINRAVTRGLDLNVSLKPSGIDWLGDIPAHWELHRLKTVGHVIMGQSPPSSECNIEENGLPFLQGSAEFGVKHPNAIQYCSTAPKKAPEGAILFSVRAPVGSMNVADQQYGIGRGLCAIVTDSASIDRNYAINAISACKVQLLMIATGSTYDAVSVGEVGAMHLPFPPIKEQLAVMKHISDATIVLSKAIERAQREIILILEYRTRLITDLVTGKLDVRHLSPELGEELAEPMGMVEEIDDKEFGEEETEFDEVVTDAND